MEADIELVIKEYLGQERQRRLAEATAAATSTRTAAKKGIGPWTSSACEKALWTAAAAQLLMDEKEVAMNQTDDVFELQQLDREWSALERLRQALQEKHQPDARHAAAVAK